MKRNKDVKSTLEELEKKEVAKEEGAGSDDEKRGDKEVDDAEEEEEEKKADELEEEEGDPWLRSCRTTSGSSRHHGASQGCQAHWKSTV